MFTIFKEYCNNSSIHGLRYLFQKDRHWTERLFWLGCCCVSVYATVYLIMTSWDNYLTSALNFEEETDYLHWNTTFPSVTLCEIERESSPSLQAYVDRRHPNSDEDLQNDYLDIYKDVVYFHYLCETCKPEYDMMAVWPKAEELYAIAFEIRLNCSQLLTNCKWNNVEFNCCDRFLLIHTEFGPCFAINSLQSEVVLPRHEMLISNMATGPGQLKFEITTNAKMYIQAPDYIANINVIEGESQQLMQHDILHRIMSVREIHNDPAVRELSVDQRQCRYGDEKTPTQYNRKYSYTACLIDCRANLQMLLCNCTHHFIYRPATTCGKEGLACITSIKIKSLLRMLMVSQKEKFDCNCVPSCTDPDYSEVYTPVTTKGDHDNSHITLTLSDLPHERLRRTVVIGNLDLVVSFGGIAGLTLGASLLSIVEVVHYFLVRPYCKKT